MTQNEPLHPLDVAFLLHAAELPPGDPQVDDYGPLHAAAGRVNAGAMERDVYGSVYFKAAALLQTLAKLPSLEHSNEAYLAPERAPVRLPAQRGRRPGAGRRFRHGGRRPDRPPTAILGRVVTGVRLCNTDPRVLGLPARPVRLTQRALHTGR